MTNYIISVPDCKSYAINAVSGFTKKCLLVMYHSFIGKMVLKRLFFSDTWEDLAYLFDRIYIYCETVGPSLTD